MGIFDFLKGRAASEKVRREELNGYLRAARDNLKLASDQVTKFLEGVRDFHPARRHEQLYHEEIRGRLIDMKSSIAKALIFLDDSSNNSINTLNTIKSPSQLQDMTSSWIKTLNANDEKVYDVLKILQVEMWGAEKAKRGFPVPRNKELVCGNLTSAVHYLTEARNQLDNYTTMNNVPEA